MNLKEWHRTVILVTLILVALGFIVWLRTGFQSNILDTLGR